MVITCILFFVTFFYIHTPVADPYIKLNSFFASFNKASPCRLLHRYSINILGTKRNAIIRSKSCWNSVAELAVMFIFITINYDRFYHQKFSNTVTTFLPKCKILVTKISKTYLFPSYIFIFVLKQKRGWLKNPKTTRKRQKKVCMQMSE